MIEMNVKELFDLTDNVTIVTGAAGQLGYQLAIALSEAGSNVVLADLILDVCEEKSKHLSEIGPEAIAVKVNVTNKKSVKKMANSVISKFGKIDILVNNAGICSWIPAEDMEFNAWKQVMDVNLNGVFLYCKWVGKEMIKQKKGSIINGKGYRIQ
jgi:NAD(P)-dependent dehydrogenase (short-subunit alcohol dehydrogenase family)